MKSITMDFLVIMILIPVSFQVISEEEITEDDLIIEATEIVQQFAGLLKPQLKAAIQTGGLVNAVDVCSVEAPKIAENLSKETGWEIKRVSLKARNKSSATPDDFEREVLHKFNERQESGELPSAIIFSQTTDKKFKFMKAQSTEGLCLACHGSSISTDVKKALKNYYPEDMATGYSLGQVRGAFSLEKEF